MNLALGADPRRAPPQIRGCCQVYQDLLCTNSNNGRCQRRYSRILCALVIQR